MDENKELDLALDLEIPTLEAELATMDEMSVVPAQETQVTNSFLKEENLTEAEAKAVADLSEKIDISNSKIVLYYGTSCQKEIASFSDAALKNIRTKDLDEVGDVITEHNLVSLKQTGAAKMREDIERRVTGNLVSMLTIRRGGKEAIVKLRNSD